MKKCRCSCGKMSHTIVPSKVNTNGQMECLACTLRPHDVILAGLIDSNQITSPLEVSKVWKLMDGSVAIKDTNDVVHKAHKFEKLYISRPSEESLIPIDELRIVRAKNALRNLGKD